MVLRILSHDADENEPRLADGYKWIGKPSDRTELLGLQQGGNSAWISPVTHEPSARVLFVSDATEVHAWLFIRPWVLGPLQGFEAYSLYTEPGERGKGYAQLLLEVALHTCGPLVSDRQGMTAAAYRLWTRACAPWQCSLVDLAGQRLPSGPTPTHFHSGHGATATHLLLELVNLRPDATDSPRA